jgi:hypothetical protein
MKLFKRDFKEFVSSDKENGSKWEHFTSPGCRETEQ